MQQTQHTLTASTRGKQRQEGREKRKRQGPEQTLKLSGESSPNSGPNCEM